MSTRTPCHSMVFHPAGAEEVTTSAWESRSAYQMRAADEESGAGEGQQQEPSGTRRGYEDHGARLDAVRRASVPDRRNHPLASVDTAVPVASTLSV